MQIGLRRNVISFEPHGSYDAEWADGGHGEFESHGSYDEDPAADWAGWYDELEPKPESCWGPSFF